MAINFRSFSNANTTSGILSIAKPSGVVAGDTLVLQLTLDVEASTLPDGFILVSGGVVTGTSGIRIYLKLATASEPANYVVQSSTQTFAAAMTALYADSGLPLEVNAVASQSNVSSTNRSFPSVTTTVANTFLMCIATLASNQNSTPDAAMTERYDIVVANHPYLMTQAIAAIGATGTRTATGTASASKVVTMALREAGSHSGTIRVTEEGVYVEEIPDPQLQVTEEGLYVEEKPIVELQVTQEGVYVELRFNADNENEIYVTELPVFAELETDGVEVTDFPVFAEFVAEGVTLTEFPVFAEFAAEGIVVTSFPVFIEFEIAPATGGRIIVGTYKTWRDQFPKNITDIPLLRAYNFIVSSNGMYMIDIEWEDVEGEDGYEIERSDDGIDGWVLVHITDPDVTQYTSIMLEPNTTYYYRIRSFNEGGYSAYSDVISETTRKIGPSLIGMTETANNTYSPIYIKKPVEVNTGDFMLMQIGVEDTDTIQYPSGWSLETIIPAGAYSNVILSRTVQSSEADYYTIKRNGTSTPIVTVAIFAWDGTADNIIFFDG